jgi:hypothetical protein
LPEAEGNGDRGSADIAGAGGVVDDADRFGTLAGGFVPDQAVVTPKPKSYMPR